MFRFAHAFHLLVLYLVALTAAGSPILAQDTLSQPMLILHHDGVVTAAAWSPDGTQILSAGEYGALRVWDAISGEMLIDAAISEPIRNAFWSADGAIIIFWTDTGHVQHLAVESGAISEPLPTNGVTRMGGVDWFHDGQSVLVWEGNTVVAPTLRGNNWSASTLSLSHDRTVISAAYNPHLDHVTTITEDEMAHIWDVASGELISSYRLGATTRDAVFSEDETLIAAWTADGRTIILNTISRSANEFRHRTFVNGARFNQSESQIMSWGADEQVKVWQIGTGQQTLELLHNDWVNGAMWNTDETRILSWAYDRVSIWDTSSGALLTQLPHENIINGASFHPNENRVLSWGWDNRVQVWDVTDFMPIK